MRKVINFLIYLYLVFFPFGVLIKVPLNIDLVNIYLTDVLIGIIVLIWLGWNFFKRRKPKTSKLKKPIFWFLGMMVLSLIFGSPRLLGKEILIAFLYLIRLVFYFGFYFVLFDLKKDFPKKFWRERLLILGVMIAIFGIWQYFFWPDLAPLQLFGWDPHFYRLAGTFLDPNFIGILLSLTLILLIVYFQDQNKKIFYSTFWFVFGALMLTYSRSSYLAFLTGVAVIAFLKKSAKTFVFWFLLLLFSILILPRAPGGEGVRLERISTVDSRLINWRESIKIFLDNPLFGVGFNAYRFARKNYTFSEQVEVGNKAGGGADSSWLFLLATTGIVGFLAFLNLGREIIKNAEKNVFVLASLAALAVHACFVNSLFYPWVLGWLMITLL